MEEQHYPGPDDSWKLEWDEFVRAIHDGRSYWGTPEDGVRAMAMIDALYRSARMGSVVRLDDPCVVAEP
ncbi:MAG: hypothetical protein GXP27_06710 [Planctomycetes bacterium]|nr:hypothetical protein [Planctomycetota bacterium]